jgi:hypothetical protein
MITTPRESGQTLVINLLFLVVLIGFVGLVVDGGNLLLQRRSAQGTADAAALAGVQDVITSRGTAEATARDYAANRNGSGVEIISVTATGSTTSTCGPKPMRRYSVCVGVRRSQNSFLAQLIGIQSTRAAAYGVATASQVQSIGGWLPIALRSGAWTSGTQLSIVPNSPTASGGPVNVSAGNNCSFSGGNIVGQVIRGDDHGGMDACPVEIGQSILTQTGVQNSQWTNQGFDQRLPWPGNNDTFNDVFEFNAATNTYNILKPDSPRIGIVPIAPASATWPLNGQAAITVQSYAIVYIGKRNQPNLLAPYTGQGSSAQNPLTIWMTPVNAVLPDDWEVTIGDYDPGAPSIPIYRLTQ